MSSVVKKPKKTGDKPNLQSCLQTYLDYIELSKYLFANEDPIYDINEMSSDHKFYKHARDIAKQMDINWKGMSHEDSNRVMLALLEDVYKQMSKVANTKDLKIEITLKIEK